jgi:AcrR family transcriptional regulator
VPRLWDSTIDAHRYAVRDAILDATAGLVAEHGLLTVRMSQIADTAGIGRATLYKYFPDVEAIVLAWHERQIARHLGHLAELRNGPGGPGRRLEAVLEAYAVHSARGHRDTDLAALLHRDVQVGRAQGQLRELVRDLLAEAAAAGDIRDDVDADELALFCLHALTASSSLRSKAAIGRLVQVTLSALRAASPPGETTLSPDSCHAG